MLIVITIVIIMIIIIIVFRAWVVMEIMMQEEMQHLCEQNASNVPHSVSKNDAPLQNKGSFV